MNLSRGSHGILRTAFLALLLGSVSCRLPGGSTALDIKPRPAPAWELKDVDGKSVHSTNYAGQVVLLTFWATWCPPCKMEIPGLIGLQKKHEKSGFSVVGISLDEAGAKVVKPFVKEYGINYPIAIGDEKVVRDFGGVDAIPKTFLIDRQGTIVAGFLGFTSDAEFEKRIVPLLAPNPSVQ